MTDLKQIETHIASAAKANGYRKKGRKFAREVDDLIFGFDLQASQWSRLFYINLWIAFPEWGSSVSPLTINGLHQLPRERPDSVAA